MTPYPVPGPVVFGTWDAPITDGAKRIDVPTNLTCLYCREHFKPGDNGGVISGQPQHRECGLRSVMGGIGHHVDHVRYCRGELGPDAGLSYRVSALLVWHWFVHKNLPTKAQLDSYRTDPEAARKETRERLLALLDDKCEHKHRTKVPGGWVCDDCHAELRKR